MKANGLKLKLSKCHFFQREIKFLGCLINKDGVKPDRKYIDKLLQMKAPKDKKEFKRWCGAIEWISRHIFGLKHIMVPLKDLGKEKTKWI